MKLFSFLILINIFSASAGNQSRVLKLQFKDNCIVLSEIQKDQIIDEYINVGSGDWLNIHTVSKSKYKTNRNVALKLAKQRNRVVGQFLIDKGLDFSSIIYKYNLLEMIWVHKPNHLKSATKLTPRSENLCYDFKNSNGLTAQFSNGNAIVFKANSFDAFLSEEINICIEEYTSKVDFVKYGVTAQGDKGMLESQGMYNIKATCNGVKVSLRKGVEYELQIKGGNDAKPFYSFYGNKKGGNINWVKQSNKKFKMSTRFETGTDEEYIENEDGDGEFIGFRWEHELTILSGSFSKLGWINCDRFYNEEETITMNFKIESEQPVQVYVVFHDINSVMPAMKIMHGAYTISGIPAGKNISIVAVNIDDKSGTGEIGFLKTYSNGNQKVDFKTERISNVEMTRLLDDVIY